MDVNRFIQLLETYLQNRADDDEQQELFLMIASGKYDEEIRTRIDASFGEDLAEMDPVKAKEILEKIFPKKSTTVIPLYKRKAVRWIAAACIIVLLGIATFTVISKRSKKSPAPVATTHDVSAPSNTRAVITLANGSKVYLDSAGNGTIAQQSNVNVIKNANGEVVYAMSPAGGGGLNDSPNNKRLGVDYNVLSNPRGSKVISLTLSDGTRVWLNSESSLKYPIAFNGNTREVEITGEAYFEVKHNSKQPFKVHLPNGSVIEDIGTAFNVNAYADEQDIKTTLIEGSVKLSPAGGGDLKNPPNYKRPGVDKDVVLKPGEQAVLSTTSHSLLATSRPDLDEVLAWKNGRFQFTDATIETILKEISRYYDAEIIYQDKIPGQFVADISRDVPVSKLLQILELTNRVHFKVEDKKIIVMK